MNSIESSIQSSDPPWANEAQEVVNTFEEAFAINKLAYSVAIVGCFVLPKAVAEVSLVACVTLSLMNVSLVQNHDFFKNRRVQIIGSGILIGITILALYHLQILAILPIFQGMCHYSAYLQLKNISLERMAQVIMSFTKHTISSDGEQLVAKGPLKSVSKLENYYHLTFNFDPFYCDKYIPELLDLAYFHKKILTIEFDSKDKCDINQFEISVDYLIRCKKADQGLDETFINAQLNHLGSISNVYFSNHLSIINGVPVINQQGAELGDISKLKQDLVDCFGSIVEIN